MSCRCSTGACSRRCGNRWRTAVSWFRGPRLQARYPAAFQLVAAMNPCPCGYLGDSSGRCHCTPGQVAAYRARLSGPLLDRIDLFVEVQRVPATELAASPPGAAHAPAMTTAAAVRSVAAARAAAAAPGLPERGAVAVATAGTGQALRRCRGVAGEGLRAAGPDGARLPAGVAGRLDHRRPGRQRSRRARARRRGRPVPAARRVVLIPVRGGQAASVARGHRGWRVAGRHRVVLQGWAWAASGSTTLPKRRWR